jgi:hypothetical protein
MALTFFPPASSWHNFAEYRRPFSHGKGERLTLTLLIKTQQPAEPGTVKPYHRFIINQGDRCGHQAPFLEFVQGCFVTAHIALFKRDAVPRKKLFRPITEHSARLSEYNYFLRHQVPLNDISGRPVWTVMKKRISVFFCPASRFSSQFLTAERAEP